MARILDLDAEHVGANQIWHFVINYLHVESSMLNKQSRRDGGENTAPPDTDHEDRVSWRQSPEPCATANSSARASQTAPPVRTIPSVFPATIGSTAGVAMIACPAARMIRCPAASAT